MAERALTDNQLYELQAALTRVCTLSSEPSNVAAPDVTSRFVAEVLECGAMYAVVGMAVIAAERFDLLVQSAERDGSSAVPSLPRQHLASVVAVPPGLDDDDVGTCLDLVEAITSGTLDHAAVWSLIRAEAEGAVLVLLGVADALGRLALQADPSLGGSLADLVRREAMRRELDWLAGDPEGRVGGPPG